MKLNKLDLYCLNSVCDDFENLQSISDQVRDELTEPTSEQELVQSIRKLADHKLVGIYSFVLDCNDFILDDTLEIQKAWIFISPSGRKELDRQWHSMQSE